jgi:hypothetical protein
MPKSHHADRAEASRRFSEITADQNPFGYREQTRVEKLRANENDENLREKPNEPKEQNIEVEGFRQLRFPIVFTDSYLPLQNLRAKFCHILFAAYAAPRESYWVMLCGVLAK